MPQLEWAQRFPAPPEQVYRHFSDVRKLNLALPAFARLELLSEPHPRLVPGMLYDYNLYLHGIPVRWRTLITEVEEYRRFVDVQAHGPYRSFAHEHEFHAIEGGTLMVDRVRYEVGWGPLQGLLDRLYVGPALGGIFLNRKRAMEGIFS